MSSTHHNTNPEGGAMLNFIYNIFPVTGTTLTSYRVETPEGTYFVPFVRVHPLTPATPLVIFG